MDDEMQVDEVGVAKQHALIEIVTKNIYVAFKDSLNFQLSTADPN